jgi:predicted nucleic acid-binding protein
VLLDTSFCIDLMDGDAGAIETARTLEVDLVQQRLSSMTSFELAYGIERTDQREEEHERVEDVLGSKPIHPATDAVMRKAGRLAGQLAADGTPIDDADAIIGATAAIVNEPVLTRNERDFRRLPGVDVETY